VKTAIALTVSLAAFVACGSGGTAAAPKGWRPVPGASAAWTNGAGAQAQQYTYAHAPFGGALQDLASSVTIDVLLHYRAAKLERSVPFAPCPGAAGVATFALAGGKILQEGFAVSNGQSIRTAYVRPRGAPADPNVISAMQTALCIAPA